MTEVFNLCYIGHLGGLNDVFQLSVNDRIILLSILYKTKKTEQEREEKQ
jgi:hypothetical protein